MQEYPRYHLISLDRSEEIIVDRWSRWPNFCSRSKAWWWSRICEDPWFVAYDLTIPTRNCSFAGLFWRITILRLRTSCLNIFHHISACSSCVDSKRFTRRSRQKSQFSAHLPSHGSSSKPSKPWKPSPWPPWPIINHHKSICIYNIYI